MTKGLDSKGLFARLLGGKTPPTVAEIDESLAALESERAQLDAQRAELERGMAEAWGTDTGGMEADYSRLQARLRASDVVLARLRGEREQAQRRDVLAAYERACMAVVAARTLRDELEPQRQAAWKAYADIKHKHIAAETDAHNKTMALTVDFERELDLLTRRELARAFADIRLRTGVVDADEFLGQQAGIERAEAEARQRDTFDKTVTLRSVAHGG